MCLQRRRDVEYVIFSRSGLTSEIIDRAENRTGLRLVSMEDIHRWAEGGRRRALL